MCLIYLHMRRTGHLKRRSGFTIAYNISTTGMLWSDYTFQGVSYFAWYTQWGLKLASIFPRKYKSRFSTDAFPECFPIYWRGGSIEFLDIRSVLINNGWYSLINWLSRKQGHNKTSVFLLWIISTKSLWLYIRKSMSDGEDIDMSII